MASVLEQLLETLDELEPEKLKRFKLHLKQRESDLADKLGNADVTDTVDQMLEGFGEERAVKITCDILKKMKHTQLAEQLEMKEVHNAGVCGNVRAQTGAAVNAPVLANNTFKGPVTFNLNTTMGPQKPSFGETSGNHAGKQNEDVLKQHKANMKEKTEQIFEGKKENKTQLKKVYTELFIAEGDITDVNNEHEIMKIDRAFKCPKFKDTPIHCNDIFRLLKQKRNGNIVLTKGIAGIGKTFSVHKFILDWTEGTANQDIDAMFLFPFREMNLIKDKHISFHEFLLEFFPELKQLKDETKLESCSLAFIFDGLDESRLPLSFNSAPLTCTNTQASVDAIFTSLVKGHLLPSSLIWITSRPAAANQIPPELIGLFTEVRGFTDPQKEEYFTKRIENKTHASEIIKHVKTSRSLYIMCHIPVFCWIAATVLHDILVRNNGEDIPTTLTEMYIHFLLIQMNMKNQKYEEKNVRERTKLLGSNKEMIFELAKVAFEQLKKENIMFYEEDLQECGIDVSEDSGMIAEILRKDSVLHEVKVYYFVHLSIQEFLAALHVFICYQNNDMDDLNLFLEHSHPKKDLLYFLLTKAIDFAWKNERGHYDLFVRFLLGISLDSNQQLLTGLLTRKESNKKSISKTIQYIKQMQNNDTCTDKSINHFFCILELQDRSLYQQIKNYLKPGSGQKREISSSNCSALVYVLVMSEEVLDDFDAKTFSATYEGRRRLVPVVRCCRRALFSDCALTETCCETLASALQIENCPLIELDLSDNFNLEAGVKTLCAGLKGSNCKLEILRLAQCHLGHESCESLVSALCDVSCRLKELDLSGNDLKNSGLQHLLLGMENTERNLEILRKVFFVVKFFYLCRLSWCNLTEKSCEILASILHSKSPLRELDVSNNDLQDSGVKLISDALKNTNCHLQILRLSGCMVTHEGCCYLASALSSNPSHLRELDLSYNHPQHSTLQLLAYQDDPNYTLDKLKIELRGERFIKSGIRKYAQHLTLDPDTAHVNLLLSAGDRSVTSVTEKQPYPDHPDRFEPFCQVLCRESLSGRCYWETEWTGSDGMTGVTYESILRKPDDLVVVEATSKLGSNSVSWALTCGARLYACHDQKDISIQTPTSRSSRDGVFVDTVAGRLSFYNVSDSHTLIHFYTFLTSFQEDLYAGFEVDSGTLTLCQLE
ncbi:NACHT, LRR and PYD domains-containing protein 12 [Triplophysa dalaica]|uniref:NACHT, LRR and PYD domains-containing protein 12 n=1 Tax=Triplophysa dalaica TaxID=1582913 RepID=UPI0024DF3A9D|nr:NACHT, LRR and PYD domains-containing protein 12 [Triplophysa dalaica]